MKPKIVTGLIAAAILVTGVQAKEFTKDRFDLLVSSALKGRTMATSSIEREGAEQAFSAVVKRECSLNSASFSLKNSTGMTKTVDLFAYVVGLDKLYYKLIQVKDYDMLEKVVYFVSRVDTRFSGYDYQDNAYIMFYSFKHTHNPYKRLEIEPFKVALTYACFNNQSNKKISGMESLAYKDFILALSNNNYKKAKDIVNKVLKHKNIYKIYKDKLAYMAKADVNAKVDFTKTEFSKITAGKYSNEFVDYYKYSVMPDKVRKNLNQKIKEGTLRKEDIAQGAKQRMVNCNQSSSENYAGIDFVYRMPMDKNNPENYIEHELNFEDCLK